MKAFLYKLTCLTNLHVGNGDVNYSIIDKEVELDYALKEATIPSSGVKGALLNYVKGLKDVKPGLIKTVFGDEDDAKGTYKFLSANLLSRPVRVSKGGHSYANATSYEMIDRYNYLCENLLIETDRLNVSPADCISSKNISEIEGIPVKQLAIPSIITKLIKEPVVILPNAKLNEIPLPVVARNNLGEKRNLWYEQFVPYNSVFYMVIITPDEENQLDELINNHIIQFGGNASVGYGLIKIEQLAKGRNV